MLISYGRNQAGAGCVSVGVFGVCVSYGPPKWGGW